MGVSQIQPFVIKNNGQYSGFEIDIWNKIKHRIGKEAILSEFKFKDLLPTLEKGEIDIAFAAISLAPERETKIDFSHSTFNSGLHILVPNQKKLSFGTIIKSILTRELGSILVLLIGFVIIAGNAIWLAERNGGGTLSGKYIPNILNSIWWSIVTIATVGYGDYTPVTLAGRLIGMVIILSGLAIFGLYIGQITSSITLSRLRTNISDKNDLRGKRVATVEHTIAVGVLENLHASVVPCSIITDAYEKLDRGDIDAVVFDAPVLLYYANNAGKGKVTVVGGLFAKNDYAFAITQNSELREQINRAILELYDNGEYQHIYKKWFGEDY